jgi:hypothetical protein
MVMMPLTICWRSGPLPPFVACPDSPFHWSIWAAALLSNRSSLRPQEAAAEGRKKERGRREADAGRWKSGPAGHQPGAVPASRLVAPGCWMSARGRQRQGKRMKSLHDADRRSPVAGDLSYPNPRNRGRSTFNVGTFLLRHTAGGQVAGTAPLVTYVNHCALVLTAFWQIKCFACLVVEVHGCSCGHIYVSCISLCN